MSEYINRQMLLDSMAQEARAVVADCDTDDMTVEYALETMECAMRDCAYNEPTADVAPVRHGYWHFVGKVASCSRCMNRENMRGYSRDDWEKFSPFCRVCGAKMDGTIEGRSGGAYGRTTRTDVVPVRHGEWLPPAVGEYGCLCSVCRAQADNDFNYCPNCGAKMDGGRS